MRGSLVPTLRVADAPEHPDPFGIMMMSSFQKKFIIGLILAYVARQLFLIKKFFENELQSLLVELEKMERSSTKNKYC